jgi:manganese/zinc/iron transport system permease protein
MFFGALGAAVVTTTLIEWIHRRSKIKQDAAIGVVFSTLFAAGVVLISLYADRVDLDQDCVLNGELALVPLTAPVQLGSWVLGPPAVVRMGVVAVLTGILILAFYKELLVTSFDPALATSLGIRSFWVHQALMLWLSIVVVSAFEAVGAILVIAMLIMPGATASLLARRLPVRLALTVLHGLLSSILGLHLGVWLDCSIGAAMVVAGSGLFGLAWLWRVWLADGSQAMLREPEPPGAVKTAVEG